MPLQKQVVPVVFSQGLDSKSDPKTMMIGKMTTLENVRFKNPTSYIKKDGYAALTNSILGGGSISAGVANGTLGPDLSILDGQSNYSYSEAESAWINKGTKQTLALSTVPIATTAQNPTSIDSATHSSGAQCVIWLDSSTLHINYVVFDSITQNPITANIDTGATVNSQFNALILVKVLPNNKFIILFSNNADNHLHYILIPVATPSSFTVNDAGANLFAIGRLDAYVSATNVYVMTSAADIAKYDLNMAFVNKIITFQNLSNQAPCLNFDSVGNHLVAVYDKDGSAYLAFYVVDMNLSLITTETIVTGATQGNPLSTVILNQIVTYFADNAISGQHVISSGSFNLTGTLTVSDYTFVRGPGLAAKAFLNASNVPMVMTGSISQLQSTYFLMFSRQYTGFKYASVAARFASGLGFNGSTFAMNIPQIVQSSSGIYNVPFLQQLNPIAIAGVVTASLGIYGVTFDYTQKPQHVEIANNLHYDGGLLSVYDGNSTVEENFNLYPESLTSTTSTLGGALSIGQYQYKAIYEWTDNYGQIQKSATSPVTTISNPANIAFQGAAGVGTTQLLPQTAAAVFALPTGTVVTTTLFPTVPAIITAQNPEWTINQAAPATATAAVVAVLRRAFIVTALDTSANTLTITSPTTKFVGTSITTGSPFFNITDASGIAVGQGLQDSDGGFPGGTTVSVITPTATGATIQASANSTKTRPNSGVTFTKGAGTFLLSQVLAVGQIVNSTDAQPNSIITAIDDGASKITLDLPIIANNPAASTIYVTNLAQGIVVVPTLRITDKVETNQKVQIVLYRTLVNQTIFHRVASQTNSITADSVTFVDNTSDYILQGNEQLYTTGGVLDNSPGPASIAMTTFKNRVILVPSENPYTWWPSKQVLQGDPVEFSAFLAQTIDAKGGQIYGVGAMDDKLVFFKKSLIFYVVGTGPSSNGLNNNFTYPELITTDKGSTNPYSILLTPMGLMFQSDNGIYLLDRKLSVSYLGAPAEIYNGATITSACLVPGTTEAKFTLNTGVSIMYDYFVNDWATHTNENAVDSLVYKGVWSHLQPGGLLMKGTPGVYTDNGSAISRKLVTGWLAFAGYQSYQRVWKFLVAGTYRSPHTMTIQAAYNFDSTIVQTISVPVLSSINPLQYRLFLQKQLCEAIQITLFDTDTPTFGAGADLSGFTFEVGVRKGAFKMAKSVSYG